jgi:hypothetical protein
MAGEKVVEFENSVRESLVTKATSAANGRSIKPLPGDLFT